MKSFFKQSLFVLLSLLSSCIPDHCKDTVCNNGGVCVDGNCSCLNGYEGINCSEIWNARFIGNWNVVDISLADAADSINYSSTLLDNGSPDQFLFLNLGNVNDSILCKRTTYADFSIVANQIVDSTLTIQSGKGYYDSVQHKIFANYVIIKNSISTSYKIILSK